MRSAFVVAVAAIALIACGGADTGRLGPASPARSAGATPTPTPINVDDMMGLYTQQTVFAASDGKISAVTLLNHAVRYTIPTSGTAQAVADGPGQFVYVSDTGSGGTRLRTFDVATGELRATRAVPIIAVPQHGIAPAIDGRLLVLHRDFGHAYVDAFDYVTLEPKGTIMQTAGCGDQLLASGSRVAIVCLATGEIAVDTLRGGGTILLADPLPKLVGAAMTSEGTIYVVTADQHLAVAASGATKLSPLPWPNEWSGTVVADGIVTAAGAPSLAIAERTDDGAWLRIFQTNNLSQRQSVRLAGVPEGGILALYPFAYYAVGTSIRHADLSTGLLETMVDVGPGARPLAVVNR